MARAGKGLTYKLRDPNSASSNCNNEQDTEESDSDSDNDDNAKQPDRPFQPLRVWKSPHPKQNKMEPTQDGSDNHNDDDDKHNNDDDDDDDDEPLERKGLPPRTIQITRPDEYGVDETVTVLQYAPIAAYSKSDVYVPPVLAKWLRPQ